MTFIEIGKIAIVGSGSIGLYYGGKLAAQGADVRFLVRSGFEEARQRGIHIFSEQGRDIHLERPSVFRDASDIGSCDLVVIALKATANDSLESLLPPLLHKDTMLLTLQNGLGNEEFLAGRHGAHRVLGGLCFVCLTRRSPASVDHVGHGMLSIGEFASPPLPRTRLIVDAFRDSGIDARLVEELTAERWRKLVWNIPFNGLAVTEGGLSVDRILADPALRARCRSLMEETIAASTALGHPIGKEYATFQLEKTYSMGPYQPSTLVDWLAGKPLEIEAIWGEPLRQAKKTGILVPHLEHLHEQLRSVDAVRS